MTGSSAPEAGGAERAVRVLYIGLGSGNGYEALAQAADRHGWTAVRAADIDSAVDECTEHWPMLAVVDVTAVPFDDADHVLAWLRRNGRIPIVSLTAPEDTAGRLLALRHGVDDHAIVPVHPDELEARLLNLVRRVERAQTRVMGDMILDRRARRVTRRGTAVRLTPREFTLLERLMAAPGEVIDKRTLQEAIGAEGKSENLVEVHMSSLRRKLEASGPAVVHTVHGSGYVFRPAAYTDDGLRAQLLEARERLVRQREEAVSRRDRLLRTIESPPDPGPQSAEPQPPEAPVSDQSPA
jgi:DNA-binding response OmpR family regulator